jgi:hypothetical protein
MHKAVELFGPQWAPTNIDPACEIIDENYDFVRCGLNSAPPAVTRVDVNRPELDAMAKELEGSVEPNDLKALRELIKQIN